MYTLDQHTLPSASLVSNIAELEVSKCPLQSVRGTGWWKLDSLTRGARHNTTRLLAHSGAVYNAAGRRAACLPCASALSDVVRSSSIMPEPSSRSFIRCVLGAWCERETAHTATAHAHALPLLLPPHARATHT